MPILNGVEVSLGHLREAACRVSFGHCNNCNTDFSDGFLIRNPNNSFAMLSCQACFNEVDFNQYEDCVDALRTACCSNCGVEAHMNSLYPVANRSITAWVCSTCIHHSENIWECYSCHTEFPRSVNRHWVVFDSNEEPICPDCTESNRGFVLSYNYNPKFRYYKTDRDKHELLYFGIELEVESCGHSKKEAIKSLPEFVYPKSDSSIRDGFEIVSHPMTYNWLQDNCDEWNKILDLRKKGWRSYNTETCGMHIHLSKEAFNTYHLFKFMKMFYNNIDFVIRFSQRNTNNLQHWATTTDKERNIIYKAKYKNMYGGENRHTAVNLGRENTVEVRIFRGTLCPPSFWKNIEFTKALYDFSRDYSVKDMNEIKFRSFIRFKRKLYPNLCGFVWDRDKMVYSVEE